MTKKKSSKEDDTSNALTLLFFLMLITNIFVFTSEWSPLIRQNIIAKIAGIGLATTAGALLLYSLKR